MIAIVVVGYDRADSMKRLLNSLAKSYYDNEEVELVISIDKGKNQDKVIKVANDFQWDFGNKNIRIYDKKQGLRRHILQCGDLTKKYDAVVVLEDDLIVSPAFYRYLKEAIKYYDKDINIAGISLYSYRVNEFCNKLFQPAYNGYDTYMMQVAQSWGQCWTKRMWEEFRKWKYSDNEIIQLDTKMPENIYHWGKSSWKKNFMAYIVEEKKFFVYPYYSYTTNCSEIGEHRSFTTSDYQVQLVENQTKWRMAPFEKSIKYDIFFERLDIKILNEKYKDKKICLDLYGMKKNFENADLLFSKKKLPYSLIQEIGLIYRPQEVNCTHLILGKGFYLYDLHIKSKKPCNKNNEYILYEYQFPGINWHFCLKYVKYRFIKAIKLRLERIIKLK